MNTYPEMNEKIVELLRMRSDPTSLYAAARIEELEQSLDVTGHKATGASDLSENKALRIVRTLACLARGDWRWLTVAPELRMDAIFINNRYDELCPQQGFASANEQSKAEFVQMVANDDPKLKDWERDARFFDCPKCHHDQVAIGRKTKCTQCGRIIFHPKTLKQAQDEYTLILFYVGNISEGYAANELGVDRLDLRKMTLDKFGKLHPDEEGEQ